MKNRFFAILLAMALLMAALPVSGLAASSKSGKVKGNSASIAITGDGIVMNIKWEKVSGAAGYEYAYNLFWKKDCKKSDYTVKSTTETGATIRLKDYGTVDIRVRAYKLARGKKVYGEWTSGRLKRSKVDKMIVKRLQKRMKTKDLFLKARSEGVQVHTGAGEQYGVIAKLSRADEVRATGSFKRDSSGTWWSQVVVSFDQNTTSKGWVSRKGTDPVWY